MSWDVLGWTLGRTLLGLAHDTITMLKTQNRLGLDEICDYVWWFRTVQKEFRCGNKISRLHKLSNKHSWALRVLSDMQLDPFDVYVLRKSKSELKTCKTSSLALYGPKVLWWHESRFGEGLHMAPNQLHLSSVISIRLLTFAWSMQSLL